MEVFVLGSGVGIPNLNRHYPGLFVESEGRSFLIDPGPGSLRQLLKLGFTYNDVDSVILTHFHPDHCLDFVSFLFACRYPLVPREKGVLVVGPAGLKDFYGGLKSVFGTTVIPERFELTLKEVENSSIAIDKTELKIEPSAHTGNSISIRFKSASGKVLCYSGDTEYCANIVELAQGADLLILECSFPDGAEVKGHLTPSHAGRIAREAGAKKLVLVHLYPMCEDQGILSQCKKEFIGNTEIASDLMKVTI
ncbi:MAG: MBL fold metallo-hydrolase [Candidatus Omnitrophica bacterium]|nr:MBL fold metallo-hydrolase [Candidatus Omnitrophota bacterium]